MKHKEIKIGDRIGYREAGQMTWGDVIAIAEYEDHLAIQLHTGKTIYRINNTTK